MPANKDFKRLVRGRMHKTGESYTTARAQLIRDRSKVAAPERPAIDYARLAGKSDSLLQAKTGCSWERWVEALDRVGAHEWSHRDIARYVQEKYKIPGWWVQTVTVGYERIKGLRAVGQRRDGSYEVNKSKTLAVPVGRLYRAFQDSRLRSRWLPSVNLKVRRGTPEKSMRITWPDNTSVIVGFTPKGRQKSQVALAHTGVSSDVAATRLKQYWTERLGALEDLLKPNQARTLH